MMSRLKQVIGLSLLGAMLLISTSCEKWTNRDLDPYSETRNEAYSLIGCSFNGTRFTQRTKNHLFGSGSYVGWNIIKIEDREYIIIHAELTREGQSNPSLSCSQLWLFMPYQDVEVGKEYSTTVYPSVARFGSSTPFVVDGKEWPAISRPIIVSVVYTKKGKTIQGKFTAEGDDLEMTDGEKASVKLENGEFSLSYSNGYAKSYSLENWLSEIERAKEVEESYSRQQQ